MQSPLPATQSTSTTSNSKRIKTRDSPTHQSIASKVDAGLYTDLDSLVSDVREACAAITAELQAEDGPAEIRDPETQRLKVASILAFKQILENTILREQARARPTKLEHGNSRVKDLENGSGKTRLEPAATADSASARRALTLYGNAPQPKQVFSSLQEPVHISAKELSHDSTSPHVRRRRTPSIHVHTPLREVGLPNGVSTTSVLPVPSPGDDDLKTSQFRTILDLFAPPPNLPNLIPPKQSKHTTTRGQTVDWYKQSDTDLSPRTSRRGTFTTQPLSTGKWLTYNALPQPSDMSSPDAKRRQRERGLSTSDPKSTPSQEAVNAHNKAKEEALFRRAYSAFAPSRDDSAAVVPQEVKSRLWWDRTGEAQFQRLFSPASNEPPEPELAAMDDDGDRDEIKVEAIDSWVPEDPPKHFTAGRLAEAEEVDEKEVAQVLGDISDLLETLNSYQRNRHLALPSTSRTTGGPTQSLSTVTGSPTSPSSTETQIYRLLKSQLSVLISTLPPYAVAKLDGDQLAELNLTSRLPVTYDEYKGVMEEDEAAVRARSNAFNAANAGARSGTPGGQYNTPNAQRPGYAPQIPNSRPAMPPNQYYQQQSSPGRPSLPQRGSSGPQAYQQPRPTSGAGHPPGPPYPQTPYGPQNARPGQPPYGPTNPGQYFQQPGYGYGPQYQTPPQGAPPAQMQGNYQRPSQPAYQQNAQQRRQSSKYSTTPYQAGRSASPQKPPNQDPHSQQRRSPYPQSAPNQSRQYFQTPGANASHQAPPSSVGASGFHTYMTAEQQASMMERQRAQLALNGLVPPVPVSSVSPQPQAAAQQQQSQPNGTNGDSRPPADQSAAQPGSKQNGAVNGGTA